VIETPTCPHCSTLLTTTSPICPGCHLAVEPAFPQVRLREGYDMQAVDRWLDALVATVKTWQR
jgi:DivIVA domain-containing protein